MEGECLKVIDNTVEVEREDGKEDMDLEVSKKDDPKAMGSRKEEINDVVEKVEGGRWRRRAREAGVNKGDGEEGKSLAFQEGDTGVRLKDGKKQACESINENNEIQKLKRGKLGEKSTTNQRGGGTKKEA